MTAAQLADMETRLEDLEQHRIDHPLGEETLRQLRAWFQSLKRQERNKVVDLDEYRRRSQ